MLTPAQLVREAAWQARYRMSCPPLNVGSDDEHALGDYINVTDPRTGNTVKVCLDQVADVAFAIGNDDLRQSVPEFAAQFLEPAAVALIEQIDRQVAAAGPKARPVFARLIRPHGEFAATDIVDGFAVRVVIQFDIHLRMFVTSVDALYGIIPEP